MATTYVPAAIRARAALKAAGFTARQVTVRDRGRYDESLVVSVRDGELDLEAVRAAVAPLRSVATCAGTGEIHAGGNVYVHVTRAA